PLTIRVTSMQFGRTTEDVRGHLPRGRQLQRSWNERQVVLIIALQNSAEQRFFVTKCRLERWSFNTSRLRQVSVRHALIAFTPKRTNRRVQCLIHIEFTFTSHQSDHLSFIVTIILKRFAPKFMLYVIITYVTNRYHSI